MIKGQVTEIIGSLHALNNYRGDDLEMGYVGLSFAIAAGYPFRYTFDVIVSDMSDVFDPLVRNYGDYSAVVSDTSGGHLGLIIDILKSTLGMTVETEVMCNQLLRESHAMYIQDGRITSIALFRRAVTRWMIGQVDLYGTNAQKTYVEWYKSQWGLR